MSDLLIIRGINGNYSCWSPPLCRAWFRGSTGGEFRNEAEAACVVLRTADKVAARPFPGEKGGVEEINSRSTNTRLTA